MCIVLYIYICHYMCQVWCSGIHGIYAQLEGVNLLWVYVHCAMYETYLVQWFPRDICLIGGVGQSAMGICALCYICHVWCNGMQGIYPWLTGGSIHHRSMLHHYTSLCESTIDPCYTNTPRKSAQGICALCYMWNLCGVLVFHASMVNWRG